MRRHLWLVAATLAATTALGGCDTWFGEVEAPPLPGERIPVLIHQQGLEPDPLLQAQAVQLPRPQANPEWPQADGYANHAMHHLAAAETPKPVWRTDVGSAADSSLPQLPPPVIAGGRVFAMDSAHRVGAFDAATGQRHWQTDLTPEDDDDQITGGVAYENGRVYASTGFAEVVALDAETGAVVWRQRVDAPVHAPPAVRGGRVFAITIDSALFALDADTGTELWVYRGIAEIAALVGGAAPAVEGGVVVAPFASGELVALTVETGRLLWGESLASRRRTDELANLSQIRAAPVIDRDRVIAVSYGGIMVAVDLRTGRRLWDRNIGGLERPWVAGQYIYVIDTERQIICLERDSGRVQWLTQLPQYEDEEDKTDPILWSGPVLAGDRLIVAGSDGTVFTVSPYTGQLIGREDFGGSLSQPPVVADGTLYFLRDDASLIAYR